MNRLINFLSLFTSVGTLICCALPALFVSLGLGAALVGLVRHVPQFVWISEHKTEVFLLAGLSLAGNGIWLWFIRNAPCPLDPELRQACLSGRRFNRVVYFVSVGIFLIGGFFAYVAPLPLS